MQSRFISARVRHHGVTVLSLGLILGAAVLFPSRALAQYSLLTSDANGTSSISGTTNWSPAGAPAPDTAEAANYTYTAGPFGSSVSLRTPTGSGNYTVYANPLIINSGVALGTKGYGNVTYDNLVLNGGGLYNSGTSSPGGSNWCYIYGSINLTASSQIRGSTAVTSYDFVYASITNAAGSNPTLSFTSGGIIALFAQNTFSGNITVLNSTPSTTLQFGTNDAVPATAVVTLNGGNVSGDYAIFNLNGFNTVIAGLDMTSGTYVGYVTNGAAGTTSTLTISNSAAVTVQNGSITDNPGTGGTVALADTGTGRLTLNSADTYHGSTTISAGTLALGGLGSINNSSAISIATNATFDVSQTSFVLGTGQTLSGGGMVNGSVQANGTIAPSGTLTINGDLTINGNLTFTVNTSLTQSNDAVVVSGALNNTGTGTLTVNNLGPALAAGDTFTLFNQPLNNGGNLTIVSPSGAIFTNNLSLNGTLTVLSVPAAPPAITSISLSGTGLVISGSNGVAGEQYNVLTSTNLALPLASWTVLPTNTFGGANFNITNPVDPNAAQSFYILRVP